jgi:hypothetical protein
VTGRPTGRRLAVAAACIAALAATLAAQARRGYVQGGDLSEIAKVPYDGRFTFARIRYEPVDGGGFGFRRGRDLKWDHDTPRAERHFTRILEELTTLRPFMEGGTILTLDDPDLFRYPIAYIVEAGFWSPTDEEAAALRTYLMKGGFLIVDDFAGEQWYGFEEAMRKVLPRARLIPMDVTHPIFDSFFHITSLDYTHPYWRLPSQFYGVFEDNDPSKRLMAIVNYNNDLAEYWEWSDTGFLPLDLTNEAYKLGVNYIVYAMTH